MDELHEQDAIRDIVGMHREELEFAIPIWKIDDTAQCVDTFCTPRKSFLSSEVYDHSVHSGEEASRINGQKERPWDKTTNRQEDNDKVTT